MLVELDLQKRKRTIACPRVYNPEILPKSQRPFTGNLAKTHPTPASINSPPPQPFHPRLCYTRARFTYCFDTRWRATRRGNPRRIETKPPRGIVRLDAARIQMLLLDAFVDACRDTRMANDPWQRGESSPRHLLETIRHRFLLIRRNFERRHLRLVPSSYR